MSSKETVDTKHKCPPHHWILDAVDYGRCKYCPAEKDFRALQRQKMREDFVNRAGIGARQSPNNRRPRK